MTDPLDPNRSSAKLRMVGVRHRCQRLVPGLVLVLAGAGPVPAQNIYERIRWYGPGWPVVMAVLTGFLIFAALMLVHYFYRRFREDHDLAVQLEKRFDEAARRVDLTAEQHVKMRDMARYDPSIQPQIIFQSITIFEKCIDLHIRKLVATSHEPSLWQDENDLLETLRKKCGFNHLPQEHPLVSTRNISIGQRGSVFGASYKTPLIHKVAVHKSSEFTFELHYDAAAEDVVRIMPGEMVKFVFSRQADGLYGTSVEVLRADGDGVIEVYHTMELKRNQLRQFVRIDVNLPMKFRLVRTAEPDSSQVSVGTQLEARMADISGGGLSFLAPQMLRPGDIITVSFNLPDCTFTTLSCKVLRISLQEGRTKTQYRHHAQYVNIDTPKRDMIVRFVFEKLRLLSQWT